LASIDAFWDLAALEPASRRALRLSLRRLAPPASVAPDQRAIDRRARRQNALILAGIALLHVLLLLGLRIAMQPPQFVRTREIAPLQITFIERRPALVVPKPFVSSPVVPQPRAIPTPQHVVPRADALQAVTIAPRTVPIPAVAQPPKALVSATDDETQVPAASQPAPPRDLLAHRSVDWMLPGGARKDSPNFHVRDDPSPQDAVNTTAGIVAALIGGVAARPDQNGIVLSAPDRGLRTSGRDSDPCDDIALDTVDLNASAKEREQAGDRLERHCQGH
jgi:hypothetical protein